MLLSATPQVNAESGIRIDPAFQEVILTSDIREATVSASIYNLSGQTLDLEIFALDFVQHPELGGIELLQRAQSQYQLSPYVSLNQKALSIPPGEAASMSATIANTSQLSPGGHYGALVARVRPAETGQLQQVLPAVSSLVLLKKIGGERYQLSLQSLEWGSSLPIFFGIPNSVSMQFHNTGNVHVIPRGVIMVKDVWGRQIQRGTVNTSSAFILPESRRTLIVPLRTETRSLPVNVLRLSVQGSVEGTDIKYLHSQDVLVLDWRFVGSILLAFSAWVGYALRQRRRKHG